MPRTHLTDLSIKALKPTGEQVTHWDENLAGFGVRVSQKGTKTFVVMVGKERKTPPDRRPDRRLNEGDWYHALGKTLEKEGSAEGGRDDEDEPEQGAGREEGLRRG